MNFIVVIPARFFSTRLPGKPLLDINGKPMITYVLERAYASGAERVIVATDHEGIAHTVKNAGGEVCMTRVDHNSGTERLVEVIEKYSFSDEKIIVNIQSDEPLISTSAIRQIVNNLVQQSVGIETLAVKIDHIKEVFNPNVVKVVIDRKGYALYFSRATIPWDRNCFSSFKEGKRVNDIFLRHSGIYGYRSEFIRRYASWNPSPLEKIEMLEQLRWLWYGEKIHVTVIKEILEGGVDTPEDLERIRTKLL